MEFPERAPRERIDEILRDRVEIASRFHNYTRRRDFLQLCSEIEHLRRELNPVDYSDIPFAVTLDGDR